MKKLAVLLMACMCFTSGSVLATQKTGKTKSVKVVKKTKQSSVNIKKTVRVKATVGNVKGKKRTRVAEKVSISNDLKYVIFEYTSGRILEEKNAHEVWPLASLTKLMTAHVFLKNHKNMGECRQRITDEDTDTIKFTHTRLQKNVDYDCSELLKAMLTVSDNYAASALARAVPGWSKKDFINEMNNQSVKWGLKNTRFVDSSGLSPGNVSSANDYYQLARYVGNTPFLTDLATIQTRRVENVDGYITVINNTNPLVRSGFKTLMSKTGYIKESGYNLAFVSDSCDRQIGFIELGARSKGERNLFASNILDKYDCK